MDAGPGQQHLGWQWVAGCRSRRRALLPGVFNPYLQAAKFDPDAAYLKRWLPELAPLPVKVLHEAWRHPSMLAARG